MQVTGLLGFSWTRAERGKSRWRGRTAVRPLPCPGQSCDHSVTPFHHHGHGIPTMKTRAAVAWAAGQPLEIDTIDLDGPKQGEVLLRNVATGVCHTDAFTLSGDDPEGLFPAILGHEGGS